MIVQKSELIKQVNAFDDSEMLADSLYEIAHNDELELDALSRYAIMEARDNLIGLQALCKNFALSAMLDEHKSKFGENSV